MSVPASFTVDGAKRIVSAVREVEQGQLASNAPDARRLSNGPPVMLVKTPGSLPGGYTGATALDGTAVELPQGSTSYQTTVSSVWIKALNGESLTAATVYHARFAGTLTQGGVTKGYFLVDAPSSGLSANYIGETCQGYYNGGSRVTTGGAFGYGYTEVSVPVGTSTAPYGTLQTWRLHHGAEPNTTFGPWAANQFKPTSGWTLPTLPSTLVGGISVSNRLRFTGKRGDLVSGTTYNCYQYSLLSFSIGGYCTYNGNGAQFFSIYGSPSTQFFESFLNQNQGSGVYGTMNLFQYEPYWSALYDPTASSPRWAAMQRGITYKAAETVNALIGFDQDIGWHIRAVATSIKTNVGQQVSAG